MNWWLCCVAVVVSVAACGAQDDLPWWKTAVFYQVYPRSFQDSDGNGVGDLKGITQKASYFSEIGVTAIWLNPFMPSPNVDFGYDVSNYTAVDPLFGTIDDFKELATTLDGLGIKLVVDFVPNHSSNEHPWFQKSLAMEEPYTDYYVWTDGVLNASGSRVPPDNWMSVFGGSVWQWYEPRNQFYYHDFKWQMPDLNYRNPAVNASMQDALKFWLDLGVDGFRMDSANYLVELANISVNEVPIAGTDGSAWSDYIHNCTQNQPETYALLESWAMLLYNYSVTTGKPRAMFIEAYTDIPHTMEYYGHDQTNLMQPFNFKLLTNGNDTSRAPDIRDIIVSWMDNMPAGVTANWVVGNHDNGRVADRYGHEMVDAINMLTATLPGVQCVYYGEELGMQDTFVRWDQTVDVTGRDLGPYAYTQGSRDPERTPMQWDSSDVSGFSTNQSTWLPINPNYWWLNVAAQQAADSSHLKVFHTMTQLRKDPVLQRGNLTVVAPDNDTLVVVRSYNDSYFALIINMGSEDRVYTSQNLFQVYNLDIDMSVAVASINYNGPEVGYQLYSKSISVNLRPKAAVLLRSYSASSSAGGLLLSLPLLLLSVLATLRR